MRAIRSGRDVRDQSATLTGPVRSPKLCTPKMILCSKQDDIADGHKLAGIATGRARIDVGEEHPQLVNLIWPAGPRKMAEAIAAALARFGGESLAMDDPAAPAQVFLALLRTDYHNRLMFDLNPPYDDEARRAQAIKATEQLLRLYGR